MYSKRSKIYLKLSPAPLPWSNFLVSLNPFPTLHIFTIFHLTNANVSVRPNFPFPNHIHSKHPSGTSLSISSSSFSFASSSLPPSCLISPTPLSHDPSHPLLPPPLPIFNNPSIKFGAFFTSHPTGASKEPDGNGRLHNE